MKKRSEGAIVSGNVSTLESGVAERTLSFAQVQKLRCDPDLQPRAALSDETVDAYAREMSGGSLQFPPILAFEIDGELFVVDGHHRVAAVKKLGKTWSRELRCEVRVGTRADALAAALAANRSHGLPRSNADKRKAVRMALLDPVLRERFASDRKLGKYIGVSHPFVAAVRRELEDGEERVVSWGGDLKTKLVLTAHPDVEGDYIGTLAHAGVIEHFRMRLEDDGLVLELERTDGGARA